MQHRKDGPPAPDPRSRPNRAPSVPALASAGAGGRRLLLSALPMLALAGVGTRARAQEDAAADAEIIALCKRHLRNWDAYNAGADADGYEGGPLWAAYVGTFDALDQVRPCTVGGLATFAHMMRVDGDGDFREEWVNIIVDGLLRLNGGAA